MGRKASANGSHHVDTQLFSVVGPSYVPDHVDEFRRGPDWSEPRPRSASGRRPGLGLYGLIALAVLLANLVYVGTIVHATTRGVTSAPVVEVSPIAPSIAIFGGNEPIRW
jgi:hypothetical protein